MSVPVSYIFFKFLNGHIRAWRSRRQYVPQQGVPSSRSGPGCLSMSLPRYNKSFRQSSGRDPTSKRSAEPFWRNEDGIVAVRAATNSCLRSRSGSEGTWAGARTVIRGGGSFENNAHQCLSGLLCEEASVGIARPGTHASSSAMSDVRPPNPGF